MSNPGRVQFEVREAEDAHNLRTKYSYLTVSEHRDAKENSYYRNRERGVVNMCVDRDIGSRRPSP